MLRAFPLKPPACLLGLLEAKPIARSMAAFARQLARCGFVAVGVHAEVLIAAAAMFTFTLAALGQFGWRATDFT